MWWKESTKMEAAERLGVGKEKEKEKKEHGLHVA
jgi:hypothetical protein